MIPVIIVGNNMNSLNVKVIKLYFWFCSELAINWCSSEVTQFNLTIVCWYKTRQTKLTAWHLLTSRHCSIIHLFIFSFIHCKYLGWNTDTSDTISELSWSWVVSEWMSKTPHHTWITWLLLLNLHSLLSLSSKSGWRICGYMMSSALFVCRLFSCKYWITIF